MSTASTRSATTPTTSTKPAASATPSRSPGAASNLQLTFAANSDDQLLVNMDIDDNAGVAHAFDVIGHALTGADTHPYNIHQVLLALQGIDPGYTLS